VKEEFTLKVNKVKQALKEGRAVLGTMIVESRTPEIARMIAAAGFDFIFIDMEHSAYTTETVIDIIRAGKAMDLVCLVRVPDAEYHLMARTLDIGAQGLMIPRVESVETVERIIQATKYPPWGERGFGARAIITDYERVETGDLTAWLNENTMVVLQIERKRAIENIDQLVSVRGVDAALIGPNDLSISLGVPSQQDHPLMVEAIQKVVDACKRHNVASGIHLSNMKQLLFWKERGMRILTYSTDAAMLQTAATEAVKELRKHL
jgi:2-keto-3-deoxy-L-rhamnonate aldolase RhmA